MAPKIDPPPDGKKQMTAKPKVCLSVSVLINFVVYQTCPKQNNTHTAIMSMQDPQFADLFGN
jgi:hypothetical protein